MLLTLSLCCVVYMSLCWGGGVQLDTVTAKRNSKPNPKPCCRVVLENSGVAEPQNIRGGHTCFVIQL